jgi:hypothetical protein
LSILIALNVANATSPGVCLLESPYSTEILSASGLSRS